MKVSAAQIAAAHAEETAADRVVTALDQIPVTYDHLSNEWLTKLLCTGHPDAEVVGFTAEDADRLNRGHKRIHLTYNERGRSAGLPESVFCKDSQQLGLRHFNAPLIAGEVRFYREIRAALGLEAPNCLLANYDPRSFNSLLVFEDMRVPGAGFCTERTPITRPRVEDQLSHLARLHARFHGELDTDPAVKGLRRFLDVYDGVQDVFHGRFGDEANRGFLAAESAIPPRLFARATDVWPATEKAFEIQRSRAVTLTHNDSHICNWYLTPDGSMRLGDWQLVAVGDWSFDLGFTMCTSLTVEDRRSWERELVEFYLDRLASHGGPRIRFADAWQNYRTQLLVGLAWWTPVVKTSVDFEFQPLDSTLEIIRRLATAVDDHDSLSAPSES